MLTRDFSSIVAIFAAIAILGIGAANEVQGDGWIIVFAFWPIYLIGLISLMIAVKQGASKLLLLVLPIFVVPAGMGAMLILACAQGDCL